MGVITALLLALVPQGPATQGTPPPPTSTLGPRLDPATGWPIVPGAAPIAESGPGAVNTPGAASRNARVSAPAAATPAFASGCEVGSPLLSVFESVHSPGVHRTLGGVTVWWRLTIYGAQGEPIGVRELTHVADVRLPDRDRIEFADGRVYGRAGASVFAERQGVPWPTLNEAAGQELALFGLHLRLPWLFADATSFAVTGQDYTTRGGQRFLRIQLERRLEPRLDVVGPDPAPRPRDRYELWCDADGQPREFVHTLAMSGETRRVLLEDWREVAGIRLPFRRIYVDGDLRQTTALEILRLEHGVPVEDRTFRLR